MDAGIQIAPWECGHKLCHEQATQAIDVFNPWARCVFIRDQDERRRSYALCDAHFARYFPRGLGYMGRAEAVALRLQCAEADARASRHAERIVDALAEPVEITDEMVERAAEVWNNEGAAGSLGTRWAQLTEYERECWRPVARAALRAALSVPASR